MSKNIYEDINFVLFIYLAYFVLLSLLLLFSCVWYCIYMAIQYPLKKSIRNTIVVNIGYTLYTYITSTHRICMILNGCVAAVYIIVQTLSIVLNIYMSIE